MSCFDNIYLEELRMTCDTGCARNPIVYYDTKSNSTHGYILLPDRANYEIVATCYLYFPNIPAYRQQVIITLKALSNKDNFKIVYIKGMRIFYSPYLWDEAQINQERPVKDLLNIVKNRPPRIAIPEVIRWMQVRTHDRVSGQVGCNCSYCSRRRGQLGSMVVGPNGVVASGGGGVYCDVLKENTKLKERLNSCAERGRKQKKELKRLHKVIKENRTCVNCRFFRSQRFLADANVSCDICGGWGGPSNTPHSINYQGCKHWQSKGLKK